MQFHLKRRRASLFICWSNGVKRPMNYTRDEEAEEVAEVVDMVPAIAVTYALDSANEASYLQVSKEVFQER
jgi:hypothetical protein